MPGNPKRPERKEAIKAAIRNVPGVIGTVFSPKTIDGYTAYTVARLLQEFRDPRAILLEIASTDTLELAKLFAGTDPDTGAPNTPTPTHIMTAVAERRQCATHVLPYVVPKMPVQLDMRHTKAIHLNIVDERQFTELQQLASDDAADPDGLSIQLINATPVEAEQSGHEDDGTGVRPSAPAPPGEADQGSGQSS